MFAICAAPLPELPTPTVEVDQIWPNSCWAVTDSILAVDAGIPAYLHVWGCELQQFSAASPDSGLTAAAEAVISKSQDGQVEITAGI